MNDEKSCGAVVYTKADHTILYLLVQSLAGVYGFPKGHMEGQETEAETALREVAEEVGLAIDLIPGFRMTDAYLIPPAQNTMKKVVYFLGVYADQTPVYQKEELAGAALFSYEEAMGVLQFDSLKRILTQADELIQTMQ